MVKYGVWVKRKPAGKFFRKKNKKIKIRFFLPKNFRKIKIDIYQIPFVLQYRVP